MTGRQKLLLVCIAAATAVAGVMHYAGASGVATFAVAGVALAGLAWIVSFATEEVGARFGPAVTGFMQSTLGNLPEFFIVIFALGKGEIVVAQNSILGSLFSKAFAVLGLVAIAGNAVENVVGIVLARKRQNDLAISVVKNSVAQIAAFLFPALILVSLLFTTPLTFALAPVYIGALFLTAIAVWQITGDGEAQPFEGWALVAMYVMLGAFAWFE